MRMRTQRRLAGPRSNAQRRGESIARSGFAGQRSNAQRRGESIARSGFAGPRSNAQRRGESGASIEPEPEAPPEAVFDRITGPYGPFGACAYRSALALPGACEYDEET
jgi:hypothetical protein